MLAGKSDTNVGLNCLKTMARKYDDTPDINEKEKDVSEIALADVLKECLAAAKNNNYRRGPYHKMRNIRGPIVSRIDAMKRWKVHCLAKLLACL